MTAWHDRPVVYLSAAAAGLVNSIYLAGISLDGFLNERNIDVLVVDFMLPFFTVPIFILALYLVSLGRSFVLDGRGRRSIGDFVFFAFAVAFAALFLMVFAVMLYLALIEHPGRATFAFAPLVIEIGATLFVAGRAKERRVGRQLLIYFLWSMSIIAGFAATGTYEALGNPPLGNGLKMVYCAILLHLTNACVFARTIAAGGR